MVKNLVDSGLLGHFGLAQDQQFTNVSTLAGLDHQVIDAIRQGRTGPVRQVDGQGQDAGWDLTGGHLFHLAVSHRENFHFH